MAGKASETRLIGTEGQFSWQQFWVYFKSDICTDEMRAWTMKNLNIVNCLAGAMAEVQYEILQYAPVELLNHPVILSKLSAKTIHDLVPCGVKEENDNWGEGLEYWTKQYRRK